MYYKNNNFVRRIDIFLDIQGEVRFYQPTSGYDNITISFESFRNIPYIYNIYPTDNITFDE